MNPYLRASLRAIKFGLRNVPTITKDRSRDGAWLQTALDVINPLFHKICDVMPVAYSRRREAVVERFAWDISDSRSWAHDCVSNAENGFALPPLDPSLPAVLQGDLVTPVDTQAIRGTMLYLHGGAYITCSPATHRILVVRLAVECGLRIVIPDYALAPRWKWPCPLMDTLGVVRHLTLGNDTEVNKWGPQQLMLGGDSAGGGLAAATALSCNVADVPLRALVMFSPWLDLTGTSTTMHFDDDLLPAERIPEIVQCLLPEGQDPKHPLASPVFAPDHALAALPPLYLAVGSGEILRGEAETLMARRAASGSNESDVLEIGEGLPHVWPALAPVLSAGHETVLNVAGWLRKLG